MYASTSPLMLLLAGTLRAIKGCFVMHRYAWRADTIQGSHRQDVHQSYDGDSVTMRRAWALQRRNSMFELHCEVTP